MLLFICTFTRLIVFSNVFVISVESKPTGDCSCYRSWLCGCECLKLHAVHWNEDLYSCYEDAAKSNEGIMILAVFLTVCIYSP